MTTQALEERMRATLWQMLWLSNGATMRMDANRVSQSKDRPGFPAGDGYPLVDEYALRWARSRTWKAKREVVQEAEKALERARRAPESENPEFGSFQWRRMVAASGLSLADEARKWHCSRSYIAKVRAQFAEFGERAA